MSLILFFFFSLSFPINHRAFGVFSTAPYAHTELINANLFGSSKSGVSISIVERYFQILFLFPQLGDTCCLSNLDGLWDGRRVAVKLFFCATYWTPSKYHVTFPCSPFKLFLQVLRSCSGGASIQNCRQDHFSYILFYDYHLKEIDSANIVKNGFVVK